jgi:glutamate 5-kinase
MKKKRSLWVIKVGSQLIVDGGPLLIRSWMQDVATLLSSYQIDIIWVSSGAIASAKKRVKKSWKTLPEKQALSAIGQPMLLEQYSIALAEQGLMASQVLLSYRDFKFASSKLNLKNTLKTLLNWQVIPILNESDAVATDEIQFGDNDFLLLELVENTNNGVVLVIEVLFDDGFYYIKTGFYRSSSKIKRMLSKIG